MRTARELMTENPTAILTQAKLSDAVQIFQALEVRHLPVVNEQRELVGMLSDRDLRALAVPRMLNGEWIDTIQTALESRVGALMSSAVQSVDTEADASEVIDAMLDQKIGAVPVVDAENHLVGIISYVDVLRELSLAE